MLKFLKPFSFLPAILIMYMIYSFSAQDGMTSAQLSYKVSYKIVETGGKLLGEDWEPWQIESIAERFHGAVRKIAHMTEYFALAVAVSFPLYVYGLRGILLILVAGLFCVAFACGDEYHQSLIAGRSPSKRDVMIDSFGIFWGIILVRIVGWTGRKTIFRPWGKKHSGDRQDNQRVNAPYSGQPYPGQPYSGQSYYGQPMAGQPLPNQPAPGPQPYPGQPMANQGYPNQPYPGQPVGQPYPGQPYMNQPYPTQPYTPPSADGKEFAKKGHGPFRSDTSYGSAPQYNPTLHQYGPGNPNYGGAQSFYGQPYANGQVPYYPPHPEAPGTDPVSDQLSEDMSLKKLMHDLKDQKKSQKKD